MTDSKRIYGIASLMLSKVRNIENTTDKKAVDNEKADILKLQKLLERELAR